MQVKRLFLSFMLAVMGVIASFAQTTYHVDAEYGKKSNDGLSWGSAFATLDDALKKAVVLRSSSDVVTIKVARGGYIVTGNYFVSGDKSTSKTLRLHILGGYAPGGSEEAEEIRYPVEISTTESTKPMIQWLNCESPELLVKNVIFKNLLMGAKLQDVLAESGCFDFGKGSSGVTNAKITFDNVNAQYWNSGWGIIHVGSSNNTDVLIKNSLFTFNKAGSGNQGIVLRTAHDARNYNQGTKNIHVTVERSTFNNIRTKGGKCSLFMMELTDDINGSHGDTSSFTSINSRYYNINHGNDASGVLSTRKVRNVTLTNNRFIGCSASIGGVAYLERVQNFTSTNNLYQGNRADRFGGALAFYKVYPAAGGKWETTKIRQENDSCYNNVAGNFKGVEIAAGGFVNFNLPDYTSQEPVDFYAKNCQYMNNTSAMYGGAFGIAAKWDEDKNPSMVKFENCRFCRNVAMGDGGQGAAIYVRGFDGISRKTNKGDRELVPGTKEVQLATINCAFSDNKSDGEGGAISSEICDMASYGDLFDGNSSVGGYDGGAIYKNDGTFIVKDGVFQNNEAKAGGAIYADNTDLFNVTDCRFFGNIANGTDGGAICSRGSSNASIMTNNQFDSNSAKDSGGSLFYKGPGVELKSTEVVNSTAKTDNGGGLWIGAGNNSKLDLSESYFKNCTSPNNGGAVYVNSCKDLDLSRSEFDECKAGDAGGGIYLAYGDGAKYNMSHVRFNKCTAGKYGGAMRIYGSCELLLSYGVFTNNEASTESGGSIYWDSTNGNIIATNMFVDGSTAAKYGGWLSAKNGLISDAGISSVFNFTNATFQNCKATSNDGGVMFIEGPYTENLTFDNVNFYNNEAPSGKGGALYTKTKRAQSFLTNVIFRNNKAVDGAAYWWKNSGGIGFTLSNAATQYLEAGYIKNSKFENNQATGSAGALWVGDVTGSQMGWGEISGNNFFGNTDGSTKYKGNSDIRFEDLASLVTSQGSRIYKFENNQIGFEESTYKSMNGKANSICANNTPSTAALSPDSAAIQEETINLEKMQLSTYPELTGDVCLAQTPQEPMSVSIYSSKNTTENNPGVFNLETEIRSDINCNMPETYLKMTAFSNDEIKVGTNEDLTPEKIGKTNLLFTYKVIDWNDSDGSRTESTVEYMIPDDINIPSTTSPDFKDDVNAYTGEQPRREYPSYYQQVPNHHAIEPGHTYAFVLTKVERWLSVGEIQEYTLTDFAADQNEKFYTLITAKSECLTAIEDLQQTPANQTVHGNVITNDYVPVVQEAVMDNIKVMDATGSYQQIPMNAEVTTDVYTKNPANGSVVRAGKLIVQTDGSYIFEPETNFVGSAEVIYDIKFVSNGMSSESTVLHLEVLPSPQTSEGVYAPIAHNDGYNVVKGQTAAINILSNDEAVDYTLNNGVAQYNTISLQSLMSPTQKLEKVQEMQPQFNSSGEYTGDKLVEVEREVFTEVETTQATASEPVNVYDHLGVLVGKAYMTTVNGKPMLNVTTEPSYIGSVEFTYVIKDDQNNLTDTATVFLTINEAPLIATSETDPTLTTMKVLQAHDDAGEAPYMQTATANYLENDVVEDLEGYQINPKMIATKPDGTKVEITYGEANFIEGVGTVTVMDGVATLQPVAGYSGTTQVAYTLNNANQENLYTTTGVIHLTVAEPIVHLWIGGTAGAENDWKTATNWKGNVIPGAGENVIFATAANNIATPSDPRTGDAVSDLYTYVGQDGVNEGVIGNITNESPMRLVVVPNSTLSVTGKMTGFVDGLDKPRLMIKANTDGETPNGGLIFSGNPCQDEVYAAVQMIVRGKVTNGKKNYTDNLPWSPTYGKQLDANYEGQQFGYPVDKVTRVLVTTPMSVKYYSESDTDYKTGSALTKTTFWSKWQPLANYMDHNTIANPFAGYSITALDSALTTPQMIQFYGRLLNMNCPNAAEFVMTRKAVAVDGVPTSYDANGTQQTTEKQKRFNVGLNVIGNPYTAAINPAAINFPAGVDETVYMFVTGTMADNATAAANSRDKGSFIGVPKNLSNAMGVNEIPSMQAFQVKFSDAQLTDEILTAGAPDVTVTIDKATMLKKNTSPQFVKSQFAEQTGSMKVFLTGENSNDLLWMFQRNAGTDNFDNGWDAVKPLSVGAKLFVETADNLDLSVSTTNSIDGQRFSFQAGADKDYALTLVKQDLDSYNELYLIDYEAKTCTALTADTTVYNFTGVNTAMATKRFAIVSNFDGNFDPTGIDTVEADVNGNSLRVNADATVRVYDMAGALQMSKSVKAGETYKPTLPQGIYNVLITTSKTSKTVKMVIK